VSVPGSKSITNRAFVLAALSQSATDIRIRGALRSEDTEVLVVALKTLGIDVIPSWNDPDPTVLFPGRITPRIPKSEADLFVANSGTSMRFLTAMLAAGHGRFRIDGIARMRERPIRDLLDALNQLPGVSASSEAGTGCPPVIVESVGLGGGTVHIRADVSSQFLSALLMVAPFAESELRIVVDGPMVSEPYIDMTLSMMADWGYRVERKSMREYHIPRALHGPTLTDYQVEPDASAASYFFAAAAIAGGRVTVSGMNRNMRQGDVEFVSALERMGCRVEECASGITVYGRPLHGIDIDMNAISDTVMTLAAVACVADGSTTIRNVGHIRHKETDRIAAIAAELRKLGAVIDERDEGLTIHPRPLAGCSVETYNDHRMAMSLALIGLRVPGVTIQNPGCVAKTYPEFWIDFERLCQ
jgi:3-phosphoshikimate 1-carboxyvinyltransferase